MNTTMSNRWNQNNLPFHWWTDCNPFCMGCTLWPLHHEPPLYVDGHSEHLLGGPWKVMKFKIHYCDDFLSWQLIIINCAALYMGPFNIYRQGGWTLIFGKLPMGGGAYFWWKSLKKPAKPIFPRIVSGINKTNKWINLIQGGIGYNRSVFYK